jgi:electron transport complex protein RnfC
MLLAMRLRLPRLRKQKHAFHGGLFLPDEKERTRDRPVEPMPLPPVVRVPLAGDRAAPCEPCVAAGQVVRCGEVIGRCDSGAHVHASADGVVRAFARCDTPHRSELPCVEIETRRAAVPHVANAAVVTTIEELIAQVETAGIVDLDGTGVSTGRRLRRASEHGCADLIVNGMDSEPCVTVEARVLVERLDVVLAGAMRLGRLLNAGAVWLTFDKAGARPAAKLDAATTGMSVRLSPLENKYPQGHPALLVRSLLNREIPVGGIDLHAGAFVLSAGTVAAIEATVRSGMPLTHRVVTVAGGAVARPGNYSIALGTSIADLFKHTGLCRIPRCVIAGGPMTGVAVRHTQAVVTQRTTAILAFADESEQGRAADWPPAACIRCGWCLDDCPVGLDPRGLLHAAERRQLEQAAAMHVHACIGCGICTYVCPAGLPLAESIQAIQRQIPCPAPGGSHATIAAGGDAGT